MLQPHHTEQVHIIAQGIFSQIDAVKVIICICAVFPWPQNRFPGALRPVFYQIKRLCCSHSVVIKPAGHDQGRNRASLVVFLPVSLFPEIVHILMFQPFRKKRHLMAQRFLGDSLDGADIQNLVPIILSHQLRPHPLF